MNAARKIERCSSAKQTVHLEMRPAFGESFDIEPTHPRAGQQVHQAQVQGRTNRLPSRDKVNFGSGLKRVSTARHCNTLRADPSWHCQVQHDDAIFTKENKQVCTCQVWQA
ncbi:hypothetical protein [Novosphingobium sp. ES2-1]|uniref:hypothetical protein n=1 Tax=Novosphingobium sp. ES2-1 TaxID=2780074 RepID=UPI00187E04EA|nr:hypothetical protein [Novosphingobium sp. ES2-1]QOV96311.1 hypothetical protein IM701_18620 [Novosphingobium sp. ES2-1]